MLRIQIIPYTITLLVFNSAFLDVNLVLRSKIPIMLDLVRVDVCTYVTLIRNLASVGPDEECNS